MAAYRRFMTHVTCRLTAENRDQLRNPTLGNRIWATFTFYLLSSRDGSERPPASGGHTGGASGAPGPIHQFGRHCRQHSQHFTYKLSGESWTRVE